MGGVVGAIIGLFFGVFLIGLIRFWYVTALFFLGFIASIGVALWQHSFTPVLWGGGLLLGEIVLVYLLSYVLPEMSFEEHFIFWD